MTDQSIKQIIFNLAFLCRDADRDFGLPSSFHSLDSYQWKDSEVNLLEIDPEEKTKYSNTSNNPVTFDAGIESDDSENSEKNLNNINSSSSKSRRNSGGSNSSSSRFLFPARQGPDEISAEQHLSLLLYLNDLLKIILDPECPLAIHSRLDKDSMVKVSKESKNNGNNNNSMCVSVFKLLFAN